MTTCLPGRLHSRMKATISLMTTSPHERGLIRSKMVNACSKVALSSIRGTVLKYNQVEEQHDEVMTVVASAG
jgi:hypothetical protein